ncbi:hypothetical protein Hypma_016017 [Hypsizygus marmoreus]|uniref:Uncharacterized protein n=1 Tax=Hypsizygus marmoreus TaxID=39966 RepID=A0A369K4N9_HYPMA|nr:hypothetical protein Hypma_016017 [Hypsizygus marmoreus]
MLYETTQAAADLENMAKDRAHASLEKDPSPVQELSILDIRSVAVTKDDPGNSWTLTFGCEGTSFVHEMTLSVQGILRMSDLPPVRGSREALQRRVMSLQQQVHIIGYDTETFQSALWKFYDIYELFSRTVPGNALLPWDPVVFTEGVSISAANRYFSRRRDVFHEEDIPFDDVVDPTGSLRDIQHNGIARTADNEVKYFRCTEEKGTKSYHAVSPACFKIGDILDVQIGIIAVPVKDDKMKMLPKLRAITLLSSKWTQDANFKTAIAKVPRTTNRKAKRRRVGYTVDDQLDEDLQKTTVAVRRLSLHQSDVHASMVD